MVITKKIWKVLVVRKLFLLLFLVTSPCYAAEPIANSTVAKIEQMMPGLPPESKKRAEVILNMAKNPEFDRIWREVNNPQQANTPQPKPPGKRALDKLEQFTKFLQEFCTAVVAVNQLGTSAQELYNFLTQGTPPPGGQAPMPVAPTINRPFYDMPSQGMPSPEQRRPFAPTRPWQSMPYPEMNG